MLQGEQIIVKYFLFTTCFWKVETLVCLSYCKFHGTSLLINLSMIHEIRDSRSTPGELIVVD